MNFSHRNQASIPVIDVIVPVLNRPANAAPLLNSLYASAPEARALFVCSPGDEEQILMCQSLGWTELVDWPPGPGDYARKIQLGYEATSAELVLLAADDLRFHPGWLEAVLAAAEFDCGVIGTNDLANPAVIRGSHSTHPVVRRCYIDERGGVVGQPGQVYFEGYDHQCVDTELCATAIARGCYYHAFDAVIEHLHPLWGTAENGATYEKSRRHTREDQRLFDSRRFLWEREAVPA